MAESWPLDGANMSPFRYGMAALEIASIVRVVEAPLGMPAVDGGAHKMTGVYGADTFLVRRAEIQGDVVTDFGRTSGDKLVLSGFSADITVARLAGSSTDWVIVDRNGTVEMVRFTNEASGLLAMDWILT
jgi:hypothetical protein